MKPMKSLCQVFPWSIYYLPLPGASSCRSTLTTLRITLTALREEPFGAILRYAKIMLELYVKHRGQQKSINTVHWVSATREGFLYINLLPSKGTAFSGISSALNRYFKAQDRQVTASPAMPARFIASSLHLPSQAGMM